MDFPSDVVVLFQQMLSTGANAQAAATVNNAASDETDQSRLIF